MLLNQPYDSKTLKGFDKVNLALLVNRYIIQDMGYNNDPNKILTTPFKKGDSVMQSVVLYGLTESEVEIPDLEFPLVSSDKKWIAFDMRKYFSVDKREQSIKKKMTIDYDFRVMMNKLTGLWTIGYVNDLARFPLVGNVFARWMSDLIVKSYSVEIGQATDVYILSLIYYSRLFNTAGVDRIDEREKLLVQYRENYYNQGAFDRVYDIAIEMDTLEQFCELLYTVTGSDRLNGFDVGVLYNTIRTSWFGGTGGSKMLIIGLEFPPIFIAMVYASLKYNSFKRSAIGTAAEKAGQRGRGLEFMKAMDSFLLQNYGG